VPSAEAGLAEIWLSEGELLGRVVLRDDIRPQSAGVLRELKKENLRTLVPDRGSQIGRRASSERTAG
jgi:Cd2+/Zn2+-exporting ATPase